MHKNDWSLIFFTLLAQMSVGIIIAITVLNFYQPSSLQSFHDGIVILSPHFIALASIAVATVISFLHLGFPAHAFNAANNLSASWLSREIAGIGLFGFGVLLVFLQFWMEWEGVLIQKLVLIYGSISGIVFLYFMSRIYMVRTIPAWNTWFTPFHFFMSGLLLGLMVMIAFLMNEPLSTIIIVIMLRLAAVLLLLRFLAAFLYKNHLVKMEHKGIDPPDFTSGSYHTLYLIRLFIIFISAIFTAYLSLKLQSVGVSFIPLIRFFAMIFFLIIVEEIIGRLMFFAGYYRVGV